MHLNLRQHLKFIARGYLAHAKPAPVIVGIAALGLMTLLDFISAKVTNELAHTEALYAAYQKFLENQNYEHFLNVLNSNQPTFVQQLLSALLSLMVLMIATGIVIYVICACRYHKGSFGNLFDGLPILLRVFWYQFITTALTFLWGMLLGVPGIIAHYRYRQGLYILLDHPEMSVMECIRASGNMMNGHKMELFQLDLSFLGWTIAQSIALNALAMGMGDPYLPSLVMLPMSAFIRMYMEFTFFLYYEHLCGVRYDSRVPNTDAAN